MLRTQLVRVFITCKDLSYRVCALLCQVNGLLGTYL